VTCTPTGRQRLGKHIEESSFKTPAFRDIKLEFNSVESSELAAEK
jgi:hypothetical protein